MALPGRVYDAYDRLLQKFREAAENASVGTVRFRPSIHACFASSRGESEFDCYLYLKDWRWRPRVGQGGDIVSIVVRAREVIRHAPLEILKSNVGVSYFKVENECAKLLQTIHFDFAEPKDDKDNHPVFHAQLTGKAIAIPESQAKEIRFDCQVDQTQVPCYRDARIPTSDMTLSSVLLCLVADHMLAHFVQQYMKALKQIENNLPVPRCDALRGSLAEGSHHVRSWHWFAHM